MAIAVNSGDRSERVEHAASQLAVNNAQAAQLRETVAAIGTKAGMEYLAVRERVILAMTESYKKSAAPTGRASSGSPPGPPPTPI